MSRVSSIFRLQEIDRSLDRSHARIEEISRILANDAQIKRLTSELQQAEEGLSSSRSAHSKADHEVESQRAKIEQTERTLYSGTIQNPKELQDRQQEAESLKRYLVTLEDRLLDAMIELEEKEGSYHQAQHDLTVAESKRVEEHGSLLAEREQLLADIERCETEREAALADVNEEDLALYNTLRERLGGIAVATEHNGNCSACGVELARSLLQEIRTGDDLIRCRQCSRILYAG